MIQKKSMLQNIYAKAVPMPKVERVNDGSASVSSSVADFMGKVQQMSSAKARQESLESAQRISSVSLDGMLSHSRKAMKLNQDFEVADDYSFNAVQQPSKSRSHLKNRARSSE